MHIHRRARAHTHTHTHTPLQKCKNEDPWGTYWKAFQVLEDNKQQQLYDVAAHSYHEWSKNRARNKCCKIPSTQAWQMLLGILCSVLDAMIYKEHWEDFHHFLMMLEDLAIIKIETSRPISTNFIGWPREGVEKLLNNTAKYFWTSRWSFSILEDWSVKFPRQKGANLLYSILSRYKWGTIFPPKLKTVLQGPRLF